MEINDYYSHKIKVISSVLIVFVVLIHSTYNEMLDYRIANTIQVILGGGGISRIAVPMFYILSGYLFYNGINSTKQCLPKILKRTRTILLPYLIWNIIFVLWYMVLEIIPEVSSFVSSRILDDFKSVGILKIFKDLFLNPAGFHLWFLRDLIVAIILSPMVYLLLVRIKWLLPIGLFIIYAIITSRYMEIIKSYGIDWHYACSVAYFSIGGFVAQYDSLDTLKDLLSKKIVLIATIIYTLDTFSKITPWKIESMLFNNFVVVCGCIVLWRGYDVIACRNSYITHTLLNKLLGYSFFIYLFHEPTFNIIKKIGLKVFGVHEWSLILLYLINPLVMCAFAIMVAKILKRLAPNVYGILVGGR